MEKDFKELLRLLQIKSLNELLIFENGKLRNSYDLYEFKYKVRSFCDMVYSAASSLINNFSIDQVISAFRNLSVNMVYDLTDKQKLLRYVANHKCD